MSIKVMSLVWDHSDAKGSALLLMLALADFADEDGVNIFPSVGTVAKKCRMTPRNVQILLHRLTASGELTIEPMAGPHGTNQYRVMTAVLAQKPAKTFRAKSFRIRNSDQGVGENAGSQGVIAATPDPSSNHQQPSTEEIDHVLIAQMERLHKLTHATVLRLAREHTNPDGTLRREEFQGRCYAVASTARGMAKSAR